MTHVASAVRTTCGLGEKPKALYYSPSTGAVDQPNECEIRSRNFSTADEDLLPVLSVGEDMHRYLGVLLRQQAETGQLALSAFTIQAQGKLMDAVAAVPVKKQLWFEAHKYSNNVVVGRVPYAVLASKLPLESLCRADRQQATPCETRPERPSGAKSPPNACGSGCVWFAVALPRCRGGADPVGTRAFHSSF